MTARTVVYLSTENLAIRRIFAARPDFWVSDNPEFAEIIIFGGGADVSPSLYGQKMIQTTSPDKNRDKHDTSVYERYSGKVKFVGICRGAQFLNVMNQGTLWQHVNNHQLDRNKSHKVVDLLSSSIVNCSSTHHQVMRPAKTGEILAIAKEASFWQDDKNIIDCRMEKQLIQPMFEPEIVWYRETNSFCFQPHPEYDKETEEYFFKMLAETGVI